jgi:hypothetical protein
MSNAKKKWLVVSGLGFLLAVIIGWNSHIRSRDEEVANKLIAEFHQRYNSSEPDDPTEYGPMIAEVMLRGRGQLGSFSQLKHCTVTRFAEPPMLVAKCSSSFKNGDVEEFFMMHHVPDDPYLVFYSVNSDKKEF